MEVRINEDGDITIEFQQHKDLYHAQSYQARWTDNITGARTKLHLPPETAKELLEKLKEVL